MDCSSSLLMMVTMTSVVSFDCDSMHMSCKTSVSARDYQQPRRFLSASPAFHIATRFTPHRNVEKQLNDLASQLQRLTYFLSFHV